MGSGTQLSGRRTTPAQATEPLLRLDGSRAADHGRGLRAALLALPWALPTLALLGAAVGWPLVELVRASLGHYGALWHEAALGTVALRTGIWVVAVVPVTLVASLALAQLFALRFPLVRVARGALILPLAASVTVTAVVFRWALDPRAGAINVVLHALGLLRLGSSDASWLTRPGWALAWMIAVGIFVAVPLTTYVLLAALGQIPPALRDAARLDGPAPWRRLWSVTVPALRPALAAAGLIDLIITFNALPIVWEMTRGGPGVRTSISTSLMFDLRGTAPGQSAALSVADLAVVMVAVLAFLRVTRPRPRDWPRAFLPVRRRRLSRGGKLAASLAGGAVAVVIGLPYLEMVVAALRPTDQQYAANLIPTHFTLTNFSAVWELGLGHSVLRSLLIAAGATTLVMFSATAAALHGARLPAGRRSVVLGLAIGAQLLGPVVLLDGLARASARVGAPTTVSLIVIDAAFNLGSATWILERSFRTATRGLRDAARLDDLTPARRLLHVRLAPGAGAVLTAIVLTFVSAWNELAVALTLTGSGPGTRRPLTAVINNQLGQSDVAWGHVLAACVISAVPAILLVALIERRLAQPSVPRPR